MGIKKNTVMLRDKTMDYNLIYNPNYDEIKLPFLKVKIIGKKVWTLLV